MAGLTDLNCCGCVWVLYVIHRGARDRQLVSHARI